MLLAYSSTKRLSYINTALKNGVSGEAQKSRNRILGKEFRKSSEEKK